MKERLREAGIPSFLSWVYARKIPKLERWSGGRID